MSLVLVQCQHTIDRTRSQSRFPEFGNSGDLAGQFSALIAFQAAHIVVNLVDETHDLVWGNCVSVAEDWGLRDYDQKITHVVHLLQRGSNHIQTTDEFGRRRVDVEPELVCVLCRHSRTVPSVVQSHLPEFIGLFEVTREFRRGLIDLVVPGKKPQEPKGTCLQSLGRCARPRHGPQKGKVTVLQDSRFLRRVETEGSASSIS